MRRQEKSVDPAVFVLILIFLFLPPLAPIAVVGFLIYRRARQAAGQSQSGRDSVGQTILRRMKAEEAKEAPYKPHAHTPVSYSYDSCAREKRLEQLKVLKDAGLLDEVEYSQRKQKILAMR